MDDLVTWLRSGRTGPDKTWPQLCDDAADAIEAAQAEIATLRAELAAAREALGKIADMTDIEADFDGFEARDIARAVLAAAPMRGEG